MGRGERTPDGQLLGNEARFYLPGTFAALAGEHARELAGQARIQHTWKMIHDLLCDAGIRPETPYGDPVGLSTDTWITLLGRLD